MIAEKEAIYRALYAPHRRLVKGLRRLLDRAAAAGAGLAVATSAPRQNVAFILDYFGLRDRFAAIVGAEDVGAGKPDPEAFLAAAARLGLAPERCAVFEDAPAGVEAARRAGMRCIAVATTYPATTFVAAPHVIACVSDFVGFGIAVD